MILYGIPFHTVVVFALGYDFLLKSILEHWGIKENDLFTGTNVNIKVMALQLMSGMVLRRGAILEMMCTFAMKRGNMTCRQTQRIISYFQSAYQDVSDLYTTLCVDLGSEYAWKSWGQIQSS